MFYRRFRNAMTSMERGGSSQSHVTTSATSPSSTQVVALMKFNSGSERRTQLITEKPKKKKKKRGSNRPTFRKVCSDSMPPVHKDVFFREVSSLSEPDMGKRSEPAKSKKLPEILTPGRLDELATPLARHVSLPLNVVMKNNERKKKLPLLVAIKPENERSERDRFMRANFNYNPYFHYRGCADEEAMEKFREPSDKYLPQAKRIMERAIAYYGTYEKFEEETGGKVLSRAQIYSSIKKYLKSEELEDEVQLNLCDDMLSRGSMTRSKGKALLNVRCVNLREYWAEGLLRHELGTHYLRSCNHRHQPWNSTRVRRELGMGPTNPTEEGLASLHSVLFRDRPYLWRASLLYYTTYMASRLSFKELFQDLEQYVYNPIVRWDYCLRAKRGQVDTSRPGAFCKDQVYLEGLLQLLKRRKILDFHLLVRLGKVSYEDVDRSSVTEIAQLEKTRIPSFMDDLTIYKKQLDHIAAVNGLTNDVLSVVE